MGLALWSMAYRLNESEPAFCRKLPSWLPVMHPDWPVGATVGLDVGASVGVYTAIFSNWCARTVAVEPNAECVAFLRALDLPDVEIVRAAASRQAGKGFIADRTDRGWRHAEASLASSDAGSTWRQPCEIVALDDIVSGTPPLICKIDVEGDEDAVLDGMTRLRSGKHVILIVEIEARHNANAEALFDRLESEDFQAFRFRRRTLEPAGPEHVRTNSRRQSGRFARLHGYRANFIFARLARETIILGR